MYRDSHSETIVCVTHVVAYYYIKLYLKVYCGYPHDDTIIKLK